MAEARLMNILVTGATGYIGRSLIPQLAEAGHRVRGMVRRLDAEQTPAGVELVRGDVLDAASLGPALAGIDVAYYLVHSMGGGEKGFRERDRAAARNFAQAARAAGVRRILYLGALGQQDAALSDHLRSRQETGEVLRRHGPPLTEFRAAIVVGSGSTSFEIIRHLTERLPVMICPRWVVTRVQPIAIEDVLAYLVAALDVAESADQIVEIGGSSVESYRSMMLTYARARGLRRLLLRVPVLTPRLSSYWLDLVTPIPAAVSRPLIEGLRSEVVCRSGAAQRLFPWIRPMNYTQAVERALGRGLPARGCTGLPSSPLSFAASTQASTQRLAG
jgi:uncharacterized protein YbjT (DUF2867 family)